jgi:hypothetical protein
VDGEFRFATAKNSNDLEEIQKFLEDAIDHRSLSYSLVFSAFC